MAFSHPTPSCERWLCRRNPSSPNHPRRPHRRPSARRDRRKRAESLLRSSDQNLAITLQSIGDAVVATDAAGRVTRMNPTAERLTGWRLAQALGRPLVSKVETASQHLLSTINSILGMSNIEAGGVQLEETDFKLAVVLTRVQSILSESAQDKGLAFVIDAGEMPM